MDRFDALHTFTVVVDSGSFSAAAERLRVAKSAVSRRVADLEAHLGAQLLNRTTRRLSLTEAGRGFYRRALRILAELDEAEQAVAGETAALGGRLRVAAPLSFGIQHLAPALTAFLREHAALTLDLDLNDREVNLVEEGFDLAIRVGELRDSTLVARRLAPIRFVACASPAYLERHGEPRAPEQLSEHAGLYYGLIPDSLNWPFLTPHGRPAVFDVPMRLRANNGDVLLHAAIDGLGVLVSPTFIAHRAIADGRLRPILTDYPLPEMAVYAVYPSRRHVPARVRALVEFLAGRFGEEPYWESRVGVGDR